LAICEQRDVKGLYKRARSGEIPELTGISAPYEEPERPELILETAQITVEQGVQIIVETLQNSGVINPSRKGGPIQS
jgi:adenylylsulfate kinase